MLFDKANIDCGSGTAAVEQSSCFKRLRVIHSGENNSCLEFVAFVFADKAFGCAEFVNGFNDLGIGDCVQFIDGGFRGFYVSSVMRPSG